MLLIVGILTAIAVFSMYSLGVKMFELLVWLVFGAVAGLLSKALVDMLWPSANKEFSGFLPTVLLGILGSFTGGFIAYLCGFGLFPIEAGGLIWSVLGSTCILVALHYYSLNANK